MKRVIKKTAFKIKTMLSMKLKHYLLLIIIIGLFLTILCVVKLDLVKTQKTSVGRYFQENRINNEKCFPIQATAFSRKMCDKTYASGKFMKVTTTSRDLFQFLHQPDSIKQIPRHCSHLSEQVKWKLAFFIKTSSTNFDRRKAIRETWGSIKIHKSAMIKVVFLVGTVSSEEVQAKLSLELNTFQDILQINLTDDSKHVPEKVLAGMQWSSENLSPDWVYASVDDDIVVFLPSLVDYLNKMFELTTAFPNFNLVPCYEDLPVVCIYNYQSKDIPARNPNIKWFISKEEFPDDYWPPHCRGGLYLMSNRMASEIFKVSIQTERLHLDDVWITGFMRKKLSQRECSILAAPYSNWIDEADEMKIQPFVRHLWGNVDNIKVDVVAELREKWKEWRKTDSRNDDCIG